MPPNNVPTVYCIDQSLEAAPKGVDVILLGDINVRLREPHDVQGEEIVEALVY